MVKFIKDLIDHFKKLSKEKVLNEFLKSMTTEEWNKLTSSVILEYYSEGEKQYVTLNNFIDAHEPTTEFHKKIEECYNGTKESLLIRSKNLTEEQRKLLNLCKNRKLDTSLIPLLETIDEYDSSEFTIDNLSDYNNPIF